MTADGLEGLDGGMDGVLTFVEVGEGRWDPVRQDELRDAFALLVVRGLLLVDLRLERGGATELLGPGDLLRPWPTEEELLPFGSSITATERTRIAVLDGDLVEVLRRWPAVGARLVAQSAVRHRRQAQHRAASQLPRVEDRILTLLWLLAERWGKVGHGGVVLPLALTHELLGRLVGARRPTVTMAIGQLVESGHIRRRPDRSVVLLPGSRQELVPLTTPLSKVVDAELLPASVAPGTAAAGSSRASTRAVVLAERASLATRAELQRRRADVLRADRERLIGRAQRAVAEAERTVARARGGLAR